MLIQWFSSENKFLNDYPLSDHKLHISCGRAVLMYLSEVPRLKTHLYEENSACVTFSVSS